MSTQDLIAECGRLGVEFVADGHRLRWRPDSALSDELRRRIREHKFEIIVALHGDLRPLRACWNCGADEFVTIVGRPNHLWFCNGCQGPYEPARIAVRWTTPLESTRAPTARGGQP